MLIQTATYANHIEMEGVSFLRLLRFHQQPRKSLIAPTLEGNNKEEIASAKVTSPPETRVVHSPAQGRVGVAVAFMQKCCRARKIKEAVLFSVLELTHLGN
jgi:hypothetical protein